MINTGIITKNSIHNFEDTYQNIKSIIENNPNLKIILELDHQANAASVEMNLQPTKIILFGNPKLGTPLMQENLLLGLDLPQKILVTKNVNGAVSVSYNDPKYLKERHYIVNKDDILEKVINALDTITTKATI
jgi:uncharacterized protein (DUF302 family)